MSALDTVPSTARGTRLRTALRRGVGGWRVTEALRRGVLLGLSLPVAGVLLHRVELVLIGAPLLLSVVVVLLAGQPVAPDVRRRRVDRPWEEPGSASAGAVVDVEGGVGADLIAVRLPVGDGRGRVHVLTADVRAIASPAAVGRVDEAPVRPDYLVAGPDGMLVFGPVTAPEQPRMVLPEIRPVPAGPVPSRPTGMVGAHPARRPGDSADLRDIRPFRPGDRVRRIDWRVTARAGELHVRTTNAEADADIVFAIDTRVDVGADVAGWTAGSGDDRVRRGGSLDDAVLAVTALAAAHLRHGDRVGLVDLGRPQLALPTRAGSRHLLAIRLRLVRCLRAAGWSGRPVIPPGRVPTGALVVVVSPFLDDAVAALTAGTARRGHPVLAVDVLPTSLAADAGDPWGAAALALVRAEHRARLAALAANNVSVLAWSGGAELGSVAALLRRLARRPAGGASRRARR